MSEGAEACCEAIRDQLNWACEHHAAALDCPDALVSRFGTSRCYGLRPSWRIRLRGDSILSVVRGESERGV